MRQAAILVGGLGTRLRSIVADRPKAMAEFEGRPFIEYQLCLLREEGIREVVLCVGHMGERIVDHCGDGSRWDLRIRYSAEPSPLGTGGALKLAEPLLNETFVLLNGDTFLPCNLHSLEERHRAWQADLTLAVCRLDEAVRFGSVAVEAGGRVSGFHEKALRQGPGYVNAGLSLMNRSLLAGISAKTPISLERDLLGEWVQTRRVFACPLEGRFVDIGTPEGHAEFARMVAGNRWDAAINGMRKEFKQA